MVPGDAGFWFHAEPLRKLSRKGGEGLLSLLGDVEIERSGGKLRLV